jgi:hypothetical protein
MGKGYVYAEIEVTHPDEYRAEYMSRSGPAVAAFDGRFVVRGGAATVVEGRTCGACWSSSTATKGAGVLCIAGLPRGDRAPEPLVAVPSLRRDGRLRPVSRMTSRVRAGGDRRVHVTTLLDAHRPRSARRHSTDTGVAAPDQMPLAACSERIAPDPSQVPTEKGTSRIVEEHLERCGKGTGATR